MGHPRKYYTHDSVLFVTLSLEQGLLLLSNPLIQKILKSCLARSLHLYPVRITHFFVHSNHIHIMLVVIGPQDTANFIGHFKAEFAHRINALFGWNKRTIWCEGYDSPVVLTPRRALVAISYLYANAARDLQEDTIDLYPNLNSWKMFLKGEHSRVWKFFRRPAVKYLTPDAHCYEGYSRAADELEASTKKTHAFNIEPNAWLEAFDITDPEKQKEWNAELINRVRKLEERARKKRQSEKKKVVGSATLLKQKLTFNYRSKRAGKRMWCLSEKRSLRIEFINKLKAIFKEAEEVYRLWHIGDYSIPYPAGLFAPPHPKLVELIEVW